MMNRRWFLCSAGLSTIGWAAARALAWSETTALTVRPKSFILLWLNGGPSQLETFDPHPGTAIGGPTRAISTAIPEIQFADSLPLLAERAGDLAVIRSVVSKEGDHKRGEYNLRTGYRPDPTVEHPTLGAIAAHELPEGRGDLPPYISIMSPDGYADGGYLGSAYQAYKISDPIDPPRNLAARVSNARLERRLSGLEFLERRWQSAGRVNGPAQRQQIQTEQALQMMRSDERRAFDVSSESPSTREAYGDTPFGRGCLAARRLVETGVRAVEVQLGGWDSHATNFDAQPPLARQVDRALSSLIDDLRSRDRLDDTLILCTGEFGRSPKINALDGRDHWPNGFSVVLAGGGVIGGQVVGATDPEGKKDPADPVTVPDLTATVLSALGIPPEREFITSLGRPIKLSDGTPVGRLLQAKG